MLNEITAYSRKLLLIIAAPVGLILVSVVGNALWDRAGSYLLDWIIRIVITFMDTMIGTYKDSIYREASKGYHEYAASSLYGLVLAGIAGLYISLIILERIRTRAGSGPDVDGPRVPGIIRIFRSRIFFYAFVLIAIANIGISISRNAYISAVTVYAQTSIDRLAPYLTEAEEEKLLAQFRNVRGTADYYTFHAGLLKLFEAHGLDHRSTPPL